MPKTIVFLADGTWNGVNVDKDGDGNLETTNVLKLFHNLAGDESIDSFHLAHESERFVRDAQGTITQVAKYLHGVGDSDNALKRALGGAFGAGLITRIVRGYTFISRNYAPGDRIVIAGFSRGAYTARALGGMIAKEGLLDYAALGHPDKEEAYQYGLYVWASYRERRVESLARRPITALWMQMVGTGKPVFAEQMIREVPIAAIGVWDTVGSLGIPMYSRKGSSENERVDLFRFADTDLSPKVQRGFHAIAIDEHRVDFSPTLWTPRNGIEQVWFSGAHSDVGGGYEESQVSDIALDWMTSCLTTAGLQCKQPAPVASQPDPLADMHDSWRKLPFMLKPRALRPIAADADVHASVDTRRSNRASPYQPSNLANWQGRFVG
jgi:uncharacterized protein (DUF2235 family)